MDVKKINRLFFFMILGMFLVFALFVVFFSRSLSSSPRDYAEVRAEGVLRIATEYNSLDYYTSGDTIEGFQYHLCKAIEKLSGIPVEIYVENSLDDCIAGLNACRYDVIAHHIPVTKESRQQFLLTRPIGLDRYILIQRNASDSIFFLETQLDLAGKAVHVTKNSPVLLRLHHLMEEIADTIYVKTAKRSNSEQLLSQVAAGEIDYAIISEAIALKNQPNFPQLDYHLDISFTQWQAWAIRKTSPTLLDSLNVWLADVINMPQY